MSANAVFSDIFQVNTFGELTFDLKSLFLIQHTNHSYVHSVTNKFTDVVVLYITINIYIRMVLKVTEAMHQTSTNFSVFIAKIILGVLLYYDTLFLCQHS